MVRSKKLLALAAVSALTLAACGSDDEPAAEPAETDAPAEEPAETDAPAEEPAETDAPAEEPAETDAPAEEPAETDAPAEEPAGAEFVVDTSGCEDPDAATAPIEGTIKIGTSIPLSGGPAVLFAPFAAGQQAYVDYYNATFGGVNGQELELIVKDDQYTADLTVANVEELVFDDEVNLLSGIIGSPNNLAIQEEMTELCMPQLWASTGAPNWGNVEEFPWTTGLLVPYAIESQVWAEFVTAELGEGSTTALFYVNNEFGQAYAEAYKEAAAERGIEIVAEETIDAAESGAPTGQMTNLVAAAPDSILAVPLGAQCIAFMTELGNAKAANTDFNPLVYQTATCASPVFFGAVANGGADGVYTSNNLIDVNNPDNADDPNVVAYLEAFAASGSDADPGGIAAAGWLSSELAVHVIQQAADAGDLSRAGIMNAARNIDYRASLLLEGLNYQMDATDGFIAEGTNVSQWSDANGGFALIGDVIDFEDSLGLYAG